MKPIRLIQLLLLALTFMPYASLRAAYTESGWWNPRYATPGLFSFVGGSYSRSARLPDQDDISEYINDISWQTNREVVSVSVYPPGTLIVGTNTYTARAQSDFGQNHAETRTFTTGFGESEDRFYFDRRSHTSIAESIWADQWTFSGGGVGSATVTLSASCDVSITNSPCDGAGSCLGVTHPGFTRSGSSAWWYRLYASVRVFDLDLIDLWELEDSDDFIEVPRQVAAFEIFQQGANQVQDVFSPFPPFASPIPNARLAPVHTNGTASFVPVAGHRYAVAGHIHIQSRDGADVDAGHTLSLDQVVLGDGLRLNSVAITNGAQFKVLTATRLSITRAGGEVTLSFPSAAEFTYDVEYKNALDASAWTPLASRAGDGSTQTVSDSNPGGSARFYRLRVQ